jgi:hypothetical protein
MRAEVDVVVKLIHSDEYDTYRVSKLDNKHSWIQNMIKYDALNDNDDGNSSVLIVRRRAFQCFYCVPALSLFYLSLERASLER